MQRIKYPFKDLCKKGMFVTLKGYMKASIRLINPFEGLIILCLFFTVYTLIELIDNSYIKLDLGK